MLDESRSPASGRVGSTRRRLLLCGSAVVVLIAIAVNVVVVASLADWLPRERAAVGLGSPLPPGDEWASINRVRQWPADWVAAVCEPPVYELRTPYERMPHATALAICEARVQPNGEYLNITIARFPSELPMQVDLFNEGYESYAFAFDRGQLLAFATFSDASATDPITGMGDSPVLLPLKKFGFNIYSSPGP